MIPIQVLIDGALGPVQHGLHVPVPEGLLQKGLQRSLSPEAGGDHYRQGQRQRRQKSQRGQGISALHRSSPP